MPSQTSNLPSPPTLPPPSTFDLLPPLHQLLSRLLDSTVYPHDEPLETKDLATAAAAIKLKIEKARTAITGLPDISRTVEDLNEEAEECARRVEKLRLVLEKMG